MPVSFEKIKAPPLRFFFHQTQTRKRKEDLKPRQFIQKERRRRWRDGEKRG